MSIPYAPMLASPALPQRLASLSPFEWDAEVKVDGVRVLVQVVSGKVTIWGRSGSDLTVAFPEVVASIEQSAAESGCGDWVLDGEMQLVGQATGEATLGDLVGRANSRRRPGRGARLQPAWVVAFDLLEDTGRTQLRYQLTERKVALTDLLSRLGHCAALQQVESARDAARLLESTRVRGLEGIVMKRRSSLYVPGQRGSAWLKVKNLHSVTGIVFASEVGKGSRSIGAFEVAMLREGKPVPVATVGSGLSEREIDELSAALAAGRFPVVEVQCLGVTRTGRLRQPVFLAVRGDVDFTAAGIEQLSTLPVTT